MELTKEYFDEKMSAVVTKEYFEERLVAFEAKMVTKDDLAEALQTQSKMLMNYTDDVAKEILEAVNAGFIKLNHRMAVLEQEHT